MKIPEEYTETEGKAYKRGWLDCERKIYSNNGFKGGKNRWEGVSLEKRVEHALYMAEAKKRKKNSRSVESLIGHANPNCRDSMRCKPHGEFGEVEYESKVCVCPGEGVEVGMNDSWTCPQHGDFEVRVLNT